MDKEEVQLELAKRLRRDQRLRTFADAWFHCGLLVFLGICILPQFFGVKIEGVWGVLSVTAGAVLWLGLLILSILRQLIGPRFFIWRRRV